MNNTLTMLNPRRLVLQDLGMEIVGGLVKESEGTSFAFEIYYEEEAGMLVHRFVRFDGCTNFRFDAQDEAMLHTCSRQELVNLGAALAAAWNLAAMEIGEKFMGVEK